MTTRVYCKNCYIFKGDRWKLCYKQCKNMKTLHFTDIIQYQCNICRKKYTCGCVDCIFRTGEFNTFNNNKKRYEELHTQIFDLDNKIYYAHRKLYHLEHIRLTYQMIPNITPEIQSKINDIDLNILSVQLYLDEYTIDVDNKRRQILHHQKIMWKFCGHNLYNNKKSFMSLISSNTNSKCPQCHSNIHFNEYKCSECLYVDTIKQCKCKIKLIS